jgi:type I restriction enzyme S subunit
LTDAGTPIILYGRLYTKYQFAISEVDTFAVPRNGAVYSQGNEVIVPASGETAEDIARASAVEKSGVLLGGDLNILRPFDFINPLFLALAISNGEPQKELAKKAQGKSVVHIHNTDIQEVTIVYPSRTEQDRIVSVFRQLDHLITLHQRQPFLHSPPDISLIVQLTPPFYTFSWEQRKLGEMGQTYTGLSGKTKDDFGHGQARFVTYMNVFSNPISNPEMTEPIEIDPKQNEVEVGDVFFTTSSETPEEVGMSSILLEKRGKTYLNSFCFGFRPSEKIDSYYLAYMLRSESTRAKIILLAQGISRYNISKNKVMEIAVSLPSLDEQKMIGQYFSQLDNLITLHQRQTIVYAVIRSIRKVILAERQYFAPPMVRKSP